MILGSPHIPDRPQPKEGDCAGFVFPEKRYYYSNKVIASASEAICIIIM